MQHVDMVLPFVAIIAAVATRHEETFRRVAVGFCIAATFLIGRFGDLL